MSCAICYDDTVEPIGLTECNHEYHQSCFNRWVATRRGMQVTCCICRRAVGHRLTIRLTPARLIEQQRPEPRLTIRRLMQEHRMFMERRAMYSIIPANEHWYTNGTLHHERSPR